MPGHPFPSGVVFSLPATSSSLLHSMLSLLFSQRHEEPHCYVIHVEVVDGPSLPHGQSVCYRGNRVLEVDWPLVHWGVCLFPVVIWQNFGWWWATGSHASGYAISDNFHHSMQRSDPFRSLRELLLHMAFLLLCYLECKCGVVRGH